jgi:hypothetical protein
MKYTFPSENQPKHAPIIPADEDQPAYIHKRLLEVDPANIPVLPSPTQSQKANGNQQNGEYRIESELEDL